MRFTARRSSWPARNKETVQLSARIMIFRETELRGAYVIELERHFDSRGFFARGWCEREFEAHGLRGSFVQGNVSYNTRKGTLRGMHYQAAPFEEDKTLRCTRGSAYVVIVDLRRESPSFRKWIGTELTETNYQSLYVPRNFATGFQTLQDDTEILYGMTQFFSPGHGRGFRWDDPSFALKWPEAETRIISEKDKSWPDFDEAALT